MVENIDWSKSWKKKTGFTMGWGVRGALPQIVGRQSSGQNMNPTRTENIGENNMVGQQDFNVD